jgi:hypothetical protein
MIEFKQESKKVSGADAAPIDVTTEMVKAGVSCFYEHDPRIYDVEKILPEVFRVMLGVNRAASECRRAEGMGIGPRQRAPNTLARLRCSVLWRSGGLHPSRPHQIAFLE